MKQYDVIIIGGGLGGLECGYILSKKGYNVCILEQNHQLGGCLQTFKRSGTIFDTGFHFVGALDEGQFLHHLFNYFNLLDLPWHRLDEEAYAEVVLDGQSFNLASGFDRFSETLAKDFPHQRKQLETYTAFLREVGTHIGNSFKPEQNTSLFEQSAYAYLQRTIDDPLLRKVLSGSSLTMELCAEKLPLYVFAQINSSFIQSAWRLKGGGSLIAEKLTENIRRMGGTILTRSKVTRLIEESGKITTVEYNGEERITAKYIISNLHPAETLTLIPESRCIRKIYRKRISNLSNTQGTFTTHLRLKPNTVHYLNRNVFIHQGDSLWDCHYHPKKKISSALVSFQIPQKGKYTPNIDILTPMHWEEVSKWADTTIEHRGDDYKEFKQRKAEASIDFISQRFPGLKDQIAGVYTSTPLTYRDYTGTWKGSSYGIQKDYNDMLQTILAPQMPVPNLLLTGQNLNLHGILGVSMTSFFTCAKITGLEELVQDLHLFN